MEEFEEYLSKINTPQHKARMSEILQWVQKKYPQLVGKIAWNQPMFTDHGTFIISFSLANQHIAMGPEKQTMVELADLIQKSGYEHGKMLIKFPWDKPIDYDLISKIIEYNIIEKDGINTFWR